MELPNLQIGKTTDRVAAGNTIHITMASGDVIAARAITSIRGSVVAFQRIEGQGWIAFDPSSNAITSSSKHIHRRRPRKKKLISVIKQYFFKGLVRFLDELLYKGGDDDITAIDDGIVTSGILGFANLGEYPTDFIAAYRKQDDLIIDLQGTKDTVIGWFLKDYSANNQWLGSDFYGINELVIVRYWAVDRYEFSNGYPFPFEGANAWGNNYTVEPFTGNIEPISIPTFTATEDGTVTETNINETTYPLQGVPTSGPERIVGTWTYRDLRTITKQFDKNVVEESPIISTNFGEIVQGTKHRVENMSIIFNIDYLEEYTENVWVKERGGLDNYVYMVWSLYSEEINGVKYIGGATDYQFNRDIVGSANGNILDESMWTVYLSSSDTVNCQTRMSINYTGNLNIQNLFTADTLEVEEDFSDRGSRVEKDSLGRIISANIFPAGNWSAQFEQIGSTTKTVDAEGSIVKLILSGNSCYMFSELNYVSSVIITANHQNDTDKTIEKEYTSNGGVSIGNTYQFHVNTEDDYWYDNFRRSSTPILEDNPLERSTWFLIDFVETVNQSHYDIDNITNLIDKVKLKNNRDNSIIEINTNSLAFIISDTFDGLFTVGNTVELPCLAYVGTDYVISPYELAMEYTVNYSAVGTGRDSQLEEQITVDRYTDDTLHTQIFNSILTREYDVIWKDNGIYYIGQATLLSYECEDLPYIEFVDTSVSKIELSYQRGKYKLITQVTLRLDTRQEIKASLLECYNVAMDANIASVVSRDNYYNYIIATRINQFNQSNAPNLFLRENPIIATASVPTNEEIENDRIMYAEILELLPDGRWIRKEEESGDVTSMNVGIPDGTTDLWSYYKEE